MRLPFALVVAHAAIASVLCSTAAVAAPPANVEHVETFRGVAQYRLKSNGMTILLAPDRNSPVFTFMVVFYQVSLGSNAGVASALVTAEKFGLRPRYLDDFPSRIRAVTTAEANAAMRKHFVPEKLHVIVAGDLDGVPD